MDGRRADRVRLLDEWVAGWTDADSEPERAEAARVIADAVRAWRPAHERSPKAPMQRRVLDLVAGLIAGGLGYWWFLDASAGAIGIPAMLLLGVILLVWAYVRRDRAEARRERRLCSACGYDLAGVPDAITSEALDGVAIGPAACPECGRRWPMLG